MKRNRPNEDVGHGVRPPGWCEPEHENTSEDEDYPPPPAKKILKCLLENEVGKAIHELNEECFSLNHFKGHRAASLIPEFDPEGEDCTVSAWLKKIDQLGDIHGWTDKVKAFHLQDKLRGQARKWYNRLDEYNYTWTEWKHMLLRAFPKHRDYSALLDEMLNRKKLPNETMTKYYQDKISMCFRCDLSDAASVSCIIRGLPFSLQSNARAFQCQRPDELYEAFLCALDDYRLPTFEAREKLNKDAKQSSSFEKKVNPEIDPCPRCKKIGHILRNCPLPDQRTCYKCGLKGHIATRCSTSPIHTKPPADTNGNVKEIKLVQNYNEIYKKIVKVNGIFLKSYIDTGSQVNVINNRIVSVLKLNVRPTRTILKGFSGGLLTSRGEVDFDLEIDNIQVQCIAHVIEVDMQDIHLLIGQPVINADQVSLVVTNGTATLRMDANPFSECQAVEENHKFKVVTSYKESLPPGASIIKVSVLGNAEENDVCTAPRLYELQGDSYSLPATLLRGREGYMKVINTGDTNIDWETGKLLTRAYTCVESATHSSREQSHKSYRPLTVLTFRWNYAIHGLQPAGYHLVNLLLHALVSLLYYRVCAMFLPEFASFVAAILFAVHPIHTEAVTGVVGRAEMLSSLFFLAALIFYARAAQRRRCTDWRYVVACSACIGVAMLCKEQGITVTGVCLVYEIFVAQKRRNGQLPRWCWPWDLWSKGSGWWYAAGEGVRRFSTVFCASLALLIARVQVMGAQLPVFTRFDNPAGASPPPAKYLTFAYLPALNAWLLALPEALCCDWTMGTVALLKSWRDPRNLATFTLLVCLLAATVHALRKRSTALSMGLVLLVVPFLPSSNLFFPVGFVVAERVLYIPSMGWCMLVAHGWRLLAKRRAKLAACALIFLLLAFSAKTYMRNWDWKTEYSIFASGLKVNRNNAKLYNNVGHALEAEGKYAEALEFFNTAVSVQPDDVGAHINVGRTYNHLGRYQEAEDAYVRAKSLLPKAKPGESYQARIAPNHLNVFLNLANLISKNATRLEEADMLYRQAISMRADYTQAYINRGDILIKLNRTKEAQEVYERALLYDSGNPDIYYNLGVVLLEQGKPSQALAYLDKALELEPEHEQALLNSAILLQELGAADLRHLARQRLLKLLDKDSTNERVHFNLGMVCMDEGDAECAERWFRAAVHLKPDFRSALFNLALLLADRRRPLEAAPFLKQLVRHHPDHVKALVLLGDIYINSVKDLDAAESCYRRILELEPENVQALHNLCVVAVERGKLAVAEECLARAAALAPHEQYIARHLAVVRARRRASPASPASPTPPPPAHAHHDEVRARWNYIPQQPPDPHEIDDAP